MKDIDEDGKFMVSSDVPYVMSLAAEAFVAEMSIRANEVTQTHQRKNIQGKDVVEAARADMDYDFLMDTLHVIDWSLKK